MSKNKKIYGDFALFSLGRISKDWSYEKNDGLIYANDGETLGDENPITFSIYYSKNESDGEITGKKSLIFNGKIFDYDLQDYEFHKDIASKLKSINVWETEILENFVFASESGSDFYFSDDELGQITIGEGGEIRLNENDAMLATESLVINGTFYRDCILSLDVESPYGLDLGDNQPDESQDLCAIIWAPTSHALNKSIEEAHEYDKKHNGSLGLFIGIIDRWKSIETKELHYCWNFILENIYREHYMGARTSIAYLARRVIKDEILFRKIIDDSKKLVDSNPSQATHIILSIVNLLSEFYEDNKSEIVLLMDEAVKKASIETADDICAIVEHIAYDADQKFGDLDFARASIESVVSRISDSKLKMSIKKKAEKILKDFL